MSKVSVYHIRKLNPNISINSTHKLSTLLVHPSVNLATQVFDGDSCLEYQLVAEINCDDDKTRFSNAFNKTCNQNGIWSEKLSPESKYTGTGIPRSSSIGDILKSDGNLFLITIDSFLLIGMNYF